MAKEYTTHTLSNGLKVFIYKATYIGSTEVVLSVKGGSFFENDENAGIHHLLEHVVTRRTKKYPRKYQIKDDMDKIGVNCSFYTNSTSVNYSFRTLNEYFPKVIDVLSDIVKNSLLHESDIIHEKRVIVEEIKRHLDNIKSFTFYQLLPQVTYSIQNKWQDTLGTPESVQNISRDAVKCIYNEIHQAENTIIKIVSSLPEQEIIAEVETRFNDYKRGKESIPKIVKMSPQKVLFEKRDTRQVSIGLGIETVTFLDSQKAALGILKIILQMKFHGKIRKELGLAYATYAWGGSDKYTGALFLGTETSKEKVVDVLAETLNIITNMDNNIQPEEFEIAKNKAKSELVYAEDNPFKKAHNYAWQWREFGSIKTMQEKVLEIDKATIQDMKNIAKKFLVKKKVGFVFVGDIDDIIEKNIRELI